MPNLFSKLVKDRFVRHTAVLMSLAVGANAINYAFQLIVGRTVGPHEYGLFGAFMSIIFLVAVPLSGVQTSFAHYIVRWSIQDPNRFEALLAAAARAAGWVALALVVLFVPISFGIRTALRADLVTVLLLFGCVVWLPHISFYSAFLQARGRFRALGIAPLGGSLLRIGLGVALLHYGFGIEAALAATALGLGLWFWLLRVATRPAWGAPVASSELRPLYKYAAPATLSLLAMSCLWNIDVVAARAFLDATNAGIYAGASVLGRVITILAGVVAVVYFPLATEAALQREAVRRVLLRGVLAVLLAVGPVAAVYVAFPRFVIRNVLGASYGPAADILVFMGAAMVVVSLLNVLVMFLLAMRQTSVVWILLGGAAAEVVMFALWHNSPLAIVRSVLGASLACLIAVGIIVLHVLRRPEGLRQVEAKATNADLK